MNLNQNIAANARLQIAGHTLLPIEKTTIINDMECEHGCAYASKELVAIIIQTPSGIQAFDIESGSITIDELMNSVPGIEAQLTSG